MLRTHNVVPTPFHNPLMPFSFLTAAISLQNPPPPPPTPTPGSVKVDTLPVRAAPPDTTRDVKVSSVKLSPHIPAHLDGYRQPDGGGGTVRNVEVIAVD